LSGRSVDNDGARGRVSGSELPLSRHSHILWGTSADSCVSQVGQLCHTGWIEGDAAMARPSQPKSFVEDARATTPVEAGGWRNGPAASADRRRSPEPLQQLVNMALAMSVVLGHRVGFAPFRNGNWRAAETPPPSM
jgi:hypothetical protein